jgi:precorrin-6B methylase 1
MYENAIKLNEDTQTLIEAIRELLEDANCVIDYERQLILLQTIAEIEATALNGGTLPDTWCY